MENNIWRIGAKLDDRVLRIIGEILSGPAAFFGLSLSSRFLIPLVLKLMSFNMVGVFGGSSSWSRWIVPSRVKTDSNWAFRRFALSVGDVADLPWNFSSFMPQLSVLLCLIKRQNLLLLACGSAVSVKILFR